MTHVVNISGLRKARACATAGCRDGDSHGVRQALAFSMATSFCLLATGPVLAGGVDRGAQIAATCASCHRLKGGDRGIPPIVGLSEAAHVRALLAYRSNERPSHVMHAIALSLGDEEITAVARFLSANEKASPP